MRYAQVNHLLAVCANSRIHGLWSTQSRQDVIMCYDSDAANLSIKVDHWVLDHLGTAFGRIVQFSQNRIYSTIHFHLVGKWVDCISTWYIPWKIMRCVNSFWPSGAIWQHSYRSTLAQVMACCLMAPSHYLMQCWLIISEVLWHSLVGRSQEIHKIAILDMSLKITNL